MFADLLETFMMVFFNFPNSGINASARLNFLFASSPRSKARGGADAQLLPDGFRYVDDNSFERILEPAAFGCL